MLRQKISQDIKQAMKDKNADKLSVLRMLMAAFDNEAISLMKKEQGLDEAEEIKVLKKEAKKRKDSVEQYRAGGRPELADKEEAELNLINTYLPAEMGESEVKKIVAEVMAAMGAVAPSQFGLVMKAVMEKTNGAADGALVSRLVKEVLK